jgi:hypothetical protein
MSSNNKNFQHTPIPVKVTYFSKKRIISEEQFYLNSTFYSVLNYFEKNLKEEKKTKLKKQYIFNNRKINLNEPLINFVQIKKNSSSSTIESVEMLIEIEEIDIIDDENLQNYNILIQPKLNPFGIFVYKPKDGIITIEHYPDKISKKYELNKFNDYSSYCNSPKFLFISGGKLDDLPIKDFWIINNQKYSIIKKNMPINKSNHSMIYINLNNNEYIFIAGGDNNLNTFYFNINLNSFEIWGKMNNLHVKPALYQSKNYLYCFNSFNRNNVKYFERTNLISEEHIWEKIYPNFDSETISFNTISFGVSSSINGCILLVGGKNTKSKSYIYDPIKNYLSLSEKGKNENIELSDKFFYKVNKYHNVALPLTLKTNKEIAVINKVKQTVRLINFSISDGISKVKFRNTHENTQNENGMVIVKAKIHERLRFQMQPEIVTAQNLTISTNEQKIDEQEIINIESNPMIDENKIYSGKTKIKKKNKNFYLSSSTVYDNLIQLLVKSFKSPENSKNLKKMVKPLGDRDNLSLTKFEPLINGFNDKEEGKKKAKINNIKYINDINNERNKRDLFENTIIEPIGQDIIMIEEFCESYYDINNFADYATPQ